MNDINQILQKYLGDSSIWYGGQVDDYKDGYKKLITYLLELNKNIQNEYYILHCLSDTYLLQKNYKKAYYYCPSPQLENKWELLANRRINLSLLAEEIFDVAGLLTLFSKRITKYGKDNIEDLSKIFKILVSDYERKINKKIIDYIISTNSIEKNEHSIYNGTYFSKYFANKYLFFEFSKCSELENIIVDFSRKAENILREEKGIPGIGEGWISETELYYKIKDEFSEYSVINHFSDSFLGRQHFDIYIPEIKLAIEYQGLQHDKPVEYFGGIEAFIKQQKRDRRKLNLCKRHGIKMIYVREGYDINNVYSDIKSRTKTMTQQVT